jgi:hypothetical protein
MEHPYNALYTAKETALLAGAHTQMQGDQSTLEHRLREMAFYLTEQQQTGADAMFVMDLHEAADMIGRKGKYHPSHDLRINRSSTG